MQWVRFTARDFAWRKSQLNHLVWEITCKTRECWQEKIGPLESTASKEWLLGHEILHWECGRTLPWCNALYLTSRDKPDKYQFWKTIVQQIALDATVPLAVLDTFYQTFGQIGWQSFWLQHGEWLWQCFCWGYMADFMGVKRGACSKCKHCTSPAAKFYRTVAASPCKAPNWPTKLKWSNEIDKWSSCTWYSATG